MLFMSYSMNSNFIRKFYSLEFAVIFSSLPLLLDRIMNQRF